MSVSYNMPFMIHHPTVAAVLDCQRALYYIPRIDVSASKKKEILLCSTGTVATSQILRQITCTNTMELNTLKYGG